MIVIGVDPGAHGAIAFYDAHNGQLVAVHDMPAHQIAIGKTKRNRVDLHGLNSLIAETALMYDCCAFIEEVHSTPMDGPVGAFAFGEAFGAVKMAVAANNVPLQLIKPQEWKAHHRLIGKEKDDSRRRASELLPAAAKYWTRKMDDGRAEAALIALYGAFLQRGK